MLKEFKEFAMKGNVMDMAIGVVIGGAFSGIVTSLVNDIIMPILGFFTAGIDFTDLKVALNEESAVMYGNFIQTIINFLIIALCMFFVVKAMNRLKKKEEPAPEAPKGPTTEELLVEIRDVLKNK